jgi:hypothetical protein
MGGPTAGGDIARGGGQVGPDRGLLGDIGAAAGTAAGAVGRGAYGAVKGYGSLLARKAFPNEMNRRDMLKREKEIMADPNISDEMKQAFKLERAGASATTAGAELGVGTDLQVWLYKNGVKYEQQQQLQKSAQVIAQQNRAYSETLDANSSQGQIAERKATLLEKLSEGRLDELDSADLFLMQEMKDEFEVEDIDAMIKALEKRLKSRLTGT